ncbi:MAG: helix-turn-helix domain-containing protein [Solirubrobacteraceae bacterium]
MTRGSLIDEVWATGPDWPTEVRVLPDGGADLIWTGDQLVVAGPDQVARMVRADPSRPACGVRFLPGAARAMFGWSGEALVDSVVPAAQVLGADESGRLSERLAAAPPDGRPRLLASWAVSDARAAARRDPAVALTADLLARDPKLRVAELADRAGYSDRQLRRRVQAEVGYAPKRLARILRLRRVVALARRDPSLSLADAAFAGGFVDQAHLSHECSELGGAPAAVVLGR